MAIYNYLAGGSQRRETDASWTSTEIRQIARDRSWKLEVRYKQNILLLTLLWLWNLDKGTSGDPFQSLFCCSSYSVCIKNLTLHSTFC